VAAPEREWEFKSSLPHSVEIPGFGLGNERARRPERLILCTFDQHRVTLPHPLTKATRRVSACL
jgi:hypothetical protein